MDVRGLAKLMEYMLYFFLFAAMLAAGALILLIITVWGWYYG